MWEPFMYHISFFYVYAQQEAVREQISHLRIDPAAEMTVSKARCALYNIEKLYIDIAAPLILLLQKYSTQQAAIIDRTWEGRS